MGTYFKCKELGDTIKEADTEINLTAIDSKISECDKDRVDKADYLMMQVNLKQLDVWSNKEPDGEHTISKNRRKDFSVFFENAIVGAFCRYRSSKIATWSIKKNCAVLGCTAILPVISSVVVYALTEEKGVMIGMSCIFTCVIWIAGLFANMYIEWIKKKNDKETWVRHSTCYGRLNLALSRFILSEKSDDDFECFVNSTYAILDQNLDQFALNLSANGLAARLDIASEKDD